MNAEILAVTVENGVVLKDNTVKANIYVKNSEFVVIIINLFLIISYNLS